MSLASKVTFDSYMAGSEVFKAGQTATKFYIILQGETKVNNSILAKQNWFEKNVLSSDIRAYFTFHFSIMSFSQETQDTTPGSDEVCPDRKHFNGDYFGEVAIMTGSPYTTSMIATSTLLHIVILIVMCILLATFIYW